MGKAWRINFGGRFRKRQDGGSHTAEPFRGGGIDIFFDPHIECYHKTIVTAETHCFPDQ